jgi:hypothetical protein
MPRKPAKIDDPEQLKRFKAMAREVEADESPDALDKAVGRVLRPPTPPREPIDAGRQVGKRQLRRKT